MDSDRTEFRVLGPLAVVRHGEPVPLPGGKAAAALAALLLDAPRTVTTTRLREALWGEDPPPSARNALQVHLSHVRRALRAGGVPERIVRQGGGYALELEPSQLDLHRVTELRRAALREAAAGNPEGAASSLRTALGIWSGQALEGVRRESLAAEAAHLDETRLATHEELIDAELESGRATEMLDELSRLVADHPLRERLRGLQMLALYRSGRQADALAAYRDAHRRLSDELGIQPSPELQELERRILRHDPSLRLASPLVLREPGDAPRRRSITALACVLRSPADSDPEAWERRVAPAIAAARRSLEQGGGVVDVLLGSTVIAVFGLRRRRERHTERAGAAALACRDAVARAVGEPVELRIGLESGITVSGSASHLSPAALGNAPAEALRLAHGARRGEIIVGERARELAGDALVLEARTDQGARLAAVETPRSRSRRPSRFVGRRKELTALRHSFAKSVEASSPRLVTVVGDPGLGKTRLADELCTRLGARCARGSCPEGGAQRTFWPLREALDELGLLDHAALETTLHSHSEGARLARVVGETVGLAEPALGGDERPIAFAALIDALAREAPLVLVVDDLHWAEPGLLDLLAELAGRCAEPVLLLCLARTQPTALHSAWPGEIISLERLSERECARIATLALGRDPPPCSVQHVANASDGNPLFAEELAAVVGAGAAGTSERPLPESIESLLAERLDRLTALEREALERGAVEGQTFHLAGVAELCRDNEAQVRETLHGLVRQGLLRSARAQLPGQEAYRFRHVLIRDAAYASLPRLLRAELHERFVDWLTGALGGELAAWESVAGTHLEASCAIRSELAPGTGTPQLALSAGELLAAAALRAESVEDLEGAAALAGRALALLPAGHTLRVELVWRAVMLLVALGRIEQALALCDARGQSDNTWSPDERPLMELARHLVLTFAGVQSPSALSSAMRREAVSVRRTERRYLEATLEASVGWRHYQRCRIRHFLDRFRSAHELAVQGNDRRQQAVCLAWIALGLVRGRTPAAEAIGHCEAMIEGGGTPRTLEAQVLLALAELHAMQGRRARARALLDRSTEIIEDLRLEWVAAKLCRHTATVELLLGDRGAAKARLTAGYEKLVAMGAPSHGATLVARLAGLAADERRADEALEHASTCRSIALHDDVLALVEALAAEARARALRREHDDALRCARAAARMAGGTDEPVLRATALVALGDASLAAGGIRDAEAAFSGAVEELEAKGHRLLASKTRRRLVALRTRQPSCG